MTIDVPQGPNRVTLDFLDYDKRWIGTASIDIVNIVGSEVRDWKAY